MKNILIVGLTLFLFTSCSKKDKKDEVCNLNDVAITAPQSEVDSVQAFLDTNNITATKHASGFFYTITEPGTGAAVANLCSNITIKYKGKLTNGSVFDQTTDPNTATFQLGRLILGWQKGIPLIKEGGKITLYIPPSLGYGNSASGPIPANSILIFDIELVAVN